MLSQLATISVLDLIVQCKSTDGSARRLVVIPAHFSGYLKEFHDVSDEHLVSCWAKGHPVRELIALRYDRGIRIGISAGDNDPNADVDYWMPAEDDVRLYKAPVLVCSVPTWTNMPYHTLISLNRWMKFKEQIAAIHYMLDNSPGEQASLAMRTCLRLICDRPNRIRTEDL